MTRRMHVTGYLYGETPEALYRFTEAACRCPYFREVIPVRRDDGQVIALVLYSDGGGEGMDAASGRLEGILGAGIEIATAGEPGAGISPQVIRGRSGEIRRGEVITMRLELEG